MHLDIKINICRVELTCPNLRGSCSRVRSRQWSPRIYGIAARVMKIWSLP